MKEHTFAFVSLPCYIMVLIGTVQVMGKSAQTCYHCESVPECAGKHGPVDKIKCNSGGEEDKNNPISCFEKMFGNVVLERGCALSSEKMENHECVVVHEGKIEYVKCFCHPSNCNLDLPNTLAMPSYSEHAKAKPTCVSERKEEMEVKTNVLKIILETEKTKKEETEKEETKKEQNPVEEKPQSRKDGKFEEEKVKENVEKKTEDVLMEEEVCDKREHPVPETAERKEKDQMDGKQLRLEEGSKFLEWIVYTAVLIFGGSLLLLARQ